MAYFPNATSGEVLANQCAECPLGEAPCPVYLVQIHSNYEQLDHKPYQTAVNMLVDDDGLCQMRPLIMAMKMQLADAVSDLPDATPPCDVHGLTGHAREIIELAWLHVQGMNGARARAVEYVAAQLADIEGNT